ncbi:hypothetical protein JCM21900_006305 [Sporobolomyces salmonicolor]
MTTTTGKLPVANPAYQPLVYSKQGYRSFHDFYPYYLGEHSNKNCHTVLQLIGTTISLGTFVRASLAALPLLLVKDRRLDVLRFGSEGWKSVAKLLFGGLVQGYVWAWIGHFFFEHNRPATFKHPFYSFLGDLTLWREVATLQRKP